MQLFSDQKALAKQWYNMLTFTSTSLYLFHHLSRNLSMIYLNLYSVGKRKDRILLSWINTNLGSLFPANIYLFKFNNENTRKMYEKMWRRGVVVITTAQLHSTKP